MTGLPPTGHNNKVSVRSKSSSIKRPISMDISENKKEGKGLFAKLKKGSSNSRLDEESQYRENSPRTVNFIHNNNHNKTTQNNALPVDRVHGRNFDSDDDDYAIYPEETSVTKMEKLFNNCEKVIRNPALVGSLLKYLINHNLDYYNLLYYLVVQHYKMIMQNKELAKDATRYINEIFTTFLHDKSILRIEHYNLKPIVMDDLKNVKDLSVIFDDSANTILKHCITESVKKVQTSIAHGLFCVESNVEAMNFDEKIACFNNVIKFIVKTLEEKLPESNQNPTKESKEQEQYLSDVILGVKTSLATIYFYFTKKDKDENSDNLSIVSSKFSSLIGKSLENLPTMTNCFLDKQPIFCSKIHKRQSGHSFFKKGKTLKGHNFLEKLFDYPAECLFCEKLIWGIAPQGFLCSHCQGASHKGCKDFVRITCQKDSRKYNRHSYNLNPQIDDDNNKSSIAEENASHDSTVNDIVDSKDLPEKKENNENESKNNSVEKEHISDDGMQISFSSVSSVDVSQNVKQNYVTSTATIIVTNNDEKPSETAFDTESMDSVSEIYSHETVKSDGDKSDLQKSHVKTMANKYDQKSIPRSQSDSTMASSTLPRSNKRPSDSVHIQELVQEQDMWSNDPDMEVGETFEADKELKSFPEHKSKEGDKAEYTRLLVLMEFHHKTKFTVMTLKRFDYLLIKSWPDDESFIFNTLSLNCIKPLYKLIKKLVDTIESCRNSETFTSDTAKKVLEWLTNDDETNLQEWLKYSIDLCCTNSLSLVKNTWQDSRKNDQRLNKILYRRYNKMVMVEQLSNMRPLLFNFPLIVNKLFRDLSKFNKFKDEAKSWKSIYEKFKLLPTFIDEHCMPLVQLINNGTIINGLDRNAWTGKITSQEPFYNFILDFPKTAFHYKLFDFQEIKISKFSESGRKVKIPAVFVKETIDAYAICYENMLVLLQKENEKYLLKQFKTAESNKCTPILAVDNVHPSKGEKKGAFYEFTLVFITVAVLIQFLFPKKDVMDKWHDFIYKIKTKMMKNNEKSININNNNEDDKHNDTDSMEFNASIHEFDSTVECKDDISEQFNHLDSNNDDSNEILKNKIQSEEVVSKFDIMKESIEEYISCINAMKQESGHEAAVFPTPSDSYEFLIGTTYDAGNILKLCNDNCNMGSLKRLSLSSISDEILEQLLINISLMKSRIENYKNSREKDTVSINDIDYIISEKQEQSIQSLEGSQPESEESDDIPFHIMENPVQSSIEVETEESEFQPEIYYQNESLTSFVNEYVNKIIADAQFEISQLSESSNNSDDHLSSQDNSFVDQISQSSN